MFEIGIVIGSKCISPSSEEMICTSGGLVLIAPMLSCN
jgi:hypothetical protein